MTTKTVAKVFTINVPFEENGMSIAYANDSLNDQIREYQEKNDVEVVSCSKPSMITVESKVYKKNYVIFTVSAVFEKSDEKYHQDLLSELKENIHLLEDGKEE